MTNSKRIRLLKQNAIAVRYTEVLCTLSERAGYNTEAVVFLLQRVWALTGSLQNAATE